MCRLDRPSSPQMCKPAPLLHACTAFGRCVNFLRSIVAWHSGNTRPCLNTKTNSGQPQGCPKRHTCIGIAPYDRVRAARPAVRYGRTSFMTVLGGGINLSAHEGKHRLLHQSDTRSRVTPSITGRATGPCPDGRSVPPDVRYLRSRQAA